MNETEQVRRRERLFWSLLVVLALAPLVAWCSIPFDRTALTIVDSYDSIESGARFGVQVGTTSEIARAALMRDGWTPVPPAVNEMMRGCGGRMLQSGERFEIYSENSWRKGFVCLFVSGARVKAVGWTFSPLSP